MRGGSNPYFKVKYGDIEVAGQTLPKNLTQAIPTVELATNSGDFYTLIMDDPDAPSQYPHIHWFVVNIRGTDFSSGQAVYDYEGPNPPLGQKHRYIFQLYQQPLGFVATPPTAYPDRGTYNKKNFIEAQQLQPTGPPNIFFVSTQKN